MTVTTIKMVIENVFDNTKKYREYLLSLGIEKNEAIDIFQFSLDSYENLLLSGSKINFLTHLKDEITNRIAVKEFCQNLK